MKTIAMMTLLAGTIAVGIAPTAEARDRDDSKRSHHSRHDADHRNQDARYGNDYAAYKKDVRVRNPRVVRKLANRLERATDELRAEARETARRNDRYDGRRITRYEARALHAVLRLERATDRFQRATHARKAIARRDLDRELRKVEEAFRHARYQARALPHSRELRRDFKRVGQLIAALDEGVGRRDRFAGSWDRYHVAQR